MTGDQKRKHSRKRMEYDASVECGEQRPAYFYETHAVEGRAVLLSHQGEEKWGRMGDINPDLWLTYLFDALVVVDDYDPTLREGYVCAVSPHDSVGSIIEGWRNARIESERLLQLLRKEQRAHLNQQVVSKAFLALAFDLDSRAGARATCTMESLSRAQRKLMAAQIRIAMSGGVA